MGYQPGTNVLKISYHGTLVIVESDMSSQTHSIQEIRAYRNQQNIILIASG